MSTTVTITRIVYATATSKEDFDALARHAKAVGWLRKDLWHRFGGKAIMQFPFKDIRCKTTRLYENLSEMGFGKIDGTVRNESIKDILNDIKACKAAAIEMMKGRISARLVSEGIPEKKRKTELSKRMRLIRTGSYEKDPFLHRTVRNCFKHGQGHADNQFVVRSDKHIEEIRMINGRNVLFIKLRLCGKYLEMHCNSNGTNVNLANTNLRIILDHDRVCVHYAATKTCSRPCGTKEAGIDKGYTEAVVDSNKKHYGTNFGKILTEYSDRNDRIMRNRNKLFALAQKHEANGNHEKAQRIRANNLGKIKIEGMRARFRNRIKDMAFKTAHALADEYGHIVSEDLTWGMSPNKWRSKGKTYNRRMSGWAKGSLTGALKTVFLQRGVYHDDVNAAYTSQIDSRTKRLEGTRKGDRFTGVDGVVLQADENAALNILDRFYDTQISRYATKEEVKRILLGRLSGATEHQ